MLIVAVIITKGRDAIFQKTGQFKITTETRSADSDDVNSVFLRCPAIQAAIKGLDQNKLSIPSTSSTRLASANSSTLLSGAFMKKAAVSAESSFISTGRADPRRIALRRSRREEIWLLCGNKHLRLPFSGKLINQPLHTDMAEMIFRLLKQQYVELSCC